MNNDRAAPRLLFSIEDRRVCEPHGIGTFVTAEAIVHDLLPTTWPSGLALTRFVTSAIERPLFHEPNLGRLRTDRDQARGPQRHELTAIVSPPGNPVLAVVE